MAAAFREYLRGGFTPNNADIGFSPVNPPWRIRNIRHGLIHLNAALFGKAPLDIIGCERIKILGQDDSSTTLLMLMPM